ncbi:MAG: hypothetical protein ACODAJ_07225, partial [Planctomycetota bacterium]
ELMGERARAFVDVRVRRGADYTTWARARVTSGDKAALSVRLEAEEAPDPLNASVEGSTWAWVRLGTLRLQDPGWHALRLDATGRLRLDQLVFSIDPNHEPSGAADTSATARLAEPEINRADDFMRSKREPGPWELVSGEWKIQELKVRDDLGRSTGRTFDPTRSANAFSFIGTGTRQTPALAVTGYPLWRNYSFEAAVRSPEGQCFGLVILRQNADNYYLLRCDLPNQSLEIVRSLDGITDTLARCRGTLRANQWYRLRFAACDGELTASIDGRRILSAVDHTFLKGQPGIWSADPKGTYFDDVLVRNLHLVVERFNDEALGGWTARGDWTANGRHVVGSGRLLCCEPFGEFEAETTLKAKGQAGLVFDWQDPKHYAAAVLDADAVEIREVADGKATVLATGKVARASKGSRRVSVSQREGRVRVQVAGREVAGAYRPTAGTGRVGLLAEGEPARFGELRLARVQSPPPAKVHNRIFAGEDTMAAWASAGSDWQVESDDGTTVAWHEMQHWGDCTVRYAFPQPSAVPGTLGFAVRGDGKSLASGYRLIVEPRDEKPATLTLLLGKKQVASGQAPAATVSRIELTWLAGCAAAFVDGERVLWHRAGQSPAGHRVALWSQGWQPALANTSVASAHVIDDYFEAAPAAWRAESGEWLMQNRWTCSPQWSWMGGSSPQAAMLWRKQAFRGDLEVHFFAAFQMRKRDSRIYRPMDLNLSICADGHNPFSGYTFLYGGWLNTRSALLKGEKVVAQTTKEDLRPPTLLDTTPSTNYLHRKWWHIAIEKHGSTVSCYVDDQLALTYEDPEPLDGGSLCVWTHDNAVMLARTWIAYEEPGQRDTAVAEPPEAVEPEAPPPSVTSSHPLVHHDFERGLGPWAEHEGEARVRLDRRGEGYAMAVTNPRAGGAFDLRFPVEPFDALAQPFLAFDYRVPPDVKVNLHVTMNERAHAVVFTDTEARVPTVPVLGSIDAQPDGQWHTARVDLRALLLACYPDAESLPVQAIALSTRSKRNYLTAGLGGNYAGATYRLDNVRLWSPGPPEATLSWDKKLTVSHALDRKPDTVPDDQPEKGHALEPKGLDDGTWYFHLKARRGDDAWTQVAHVPLEVDASPPAVAATVPKADSASAAHTVHVPFDDASGVVPKSLKVALQGTEHPVQVDPTSPTASFEPAAVTFDPARQRLAVDLARLPLTFKDGQKVTLEVAAAQDFMGHGMKPFELTWAYDREADKQPPTHLSLEGSHLDLCRDDFETGLGQWSAHETYSAIERDRSTAASGQYSLRVYCPYSGGPFTVIARSEPFDAGSYPLVAFDYKVPHNVRVDILLTVGGKNYTVRFTDPNGSDCIGAIPGIQTDNQWHHTEFNLHEMLTKVPADKGTHTISRLAFADTGYYGNADGVEYHIDNFVISPAASTRSKPLTWSLAATDPSGIAAVQHSLAAMPETVKWQDAEKPSWSFRKLGAGLFHFRARVRDGAGNWSEPLHRQVLVDDKPPEIRKVAPKPDSRTATARIEVALADSPSGVDRAQTVLTVAGKKYTPSTDGVVYNPRTHTLLWNGTELDEPVTFDNGQKVAVQLAAQDNVGNTAKRTWTWTMDYKHDKDAPPAPYVTRVPQNVLCRDTFEKDTGKWKDYGNYGEIARTSRTAATGRCSLQITAQRTRRYFGAYAYRGTIKTEKYPIVSFDYRFPAGLPMNLHIYNGSWRTIRLTSPTARRTVIGRVPLKADNHWHHAEFNLHDILKKAGTATRIKYILFCDWATRSVRAGTRFYIDNFTVAAPAAADKLHFEWTSVKDFTGVAGYAYALDKAKDTKPAKLKGADLTAALDNPGPGQWYFHLRARDGAGNWSPPVHFPFTVPAPPDKK